MLLKLSNHFFAELGKNNRRGDENLTLNSTNFLHIYAQHMPHHESFIVGNTSALLKLREMIDEALKEGEATRDFTASDLEDYQTFVMKIADEEIALFESLEMPYTDQYGEVNSHIFFVNETQNGSTPRSPITLSKNYKRTT